MDDNLHTKIEVLEEKVSNWMETTKSYRKQLCEKIDDLKTGTSELKDTVSGLVDKINLLPCRERESWYQNISRQVTFIWVVLGSVVGGLILKGIYAFAQNGK